MCGIAGELRFNSQPSQANWETISKLMQRRGPDDSGAWNNDRCNLVFRRLSIIDLSSAAHQPMVSCPSARGHPSRHQKNRPVEKRQHGPPLRGGG